MAVLWLFVVVDEVGLWWLVFLLIRVAVVLVGLSGSGLWVMVGC